MAQARTQKSQPMPIDQEKLKKEIPQPSEKSQNFSQAPDSDGLSETTETARRITAPAWRPGPQGRRPWDHSGLGFSGDHPENSDEESQENNHAETVPDILTSSQENMHSPHPVNFDNSLGMSQAGKAFSESTPNNGVLVGFQVTLKKWGNNDCIESVQPLYRSLKTGGGKRGEVHGNANGESKRVYAPEGYAVGGMNGRAVAVIDGFELIYMKIKSDGTLDPNDTQTSDWVGNLQTGARKTIDGKGKPVTEVKGYADNYISSMEFVF